MFHTVVLREREAAAKMKEMEEYLDLRALQARQVVMVMVMVMVVVWWWL